ncbi:MAG TPA: hypothetical protein VMU59_12390 [Caulobacteraceae bacterium]|nr:hypothetical protein [Caulobacteraceae bacterium]
MPHYSALIEDDRYTVPTLVLFEAPGEAEACRIALGHLHESDHHRAVELVLDERPILHRRKDGLGAGEPAH